MTLFTEKPDWEVDGATWPHRETSAFVDVDPFRWHVQRIGEGPPVLLLHGAGASAHSWAGLAPLLSAHGDVVSIDLPGHGFTQARQWTTPTLSLVARQIGVLLNALDMRPKIVIGHSAGAAIMIRMARLGLIAPERLVSINGALTPFDGAAGLLFPIAAKLMYYNPLTAHWLSRSARDPDRVKRLIEQTGSQSLEPYFSCYTVLMQRSGHVSGALGMMAHWNLTRLRDDIRRLKAPVLFLAGGKDKAVPPNEANDAAALAPAGTAEILEDLGHLAHEEAPDRIAARIMSFVET
ncbi:MAG: alpha/beta fold hydrolase BchO [Hyphococcus sp.]